MQNVSFNSPSNLNVICISSFEKCSSLKKVELPSTIQIIGKFAFKDCTELNEINIPSSLETMQPSVFDGCPLLNELQIPQTVKMSDFNTADKTDMKIFVFSYSDFKNYVYEQIFNIQNNRRQMYVTNSNENERDRISYSFSNLRNEGGLVNLTKESEKTFFKFANGAIFVFDITDQRSLDNAKLNFYEVSDVRFSPVHAVFLGDKKFGNNYNIAVTEKLDEFKTEYKIRYFEISSGNGENIIDAIKYIEESSFYKFELYDNVPMSIDIASQYDHENSRCSC